jgi:peroxiredoxin Q/BCP
MTSPFFLPQRPQRVTWSNAIIFGVVASVLVGSECTSISEPMSLRRIPEVGERAPDFTLAGPGGAAVKLGDLLKRGPIVLYFYPKDETSGCTVEACSFRDSHEDFLKAAAQVVGISRDDEESHKRFVAKHHLPFLLLSDPNEEVHAAYGVGKMLGVFKDRVTFVIDRQGIVRHVFTSKIRMRAHMAEALAAIRQLPP